MMEPLLLGLPDRDRAAEPELSLTESVQTASTGSPEHSNPKWRRRKNVKSRTGCLTWLALLFPCFQSVVANFNSKLVHFQAPSTQESLRNSTSELEFDASSVTRQSHAA